MITLKFQEVIFFLEIQNHSPNSTGRVLLCLSDKSGHKKKIHKTNKGLSLFPVMLLIEELLTDSLLLSYFQVFMAHNCFLQKMTLESTKFPDQSSTSLLLNKLRRGRQGPQTSEQRLKTPSSTPHPSQQHHAASPPGSPG